MQRIRWDYGWTSISWRAHPSILRGFTYVKRANGTLGLRARDRMHYVVRQLGIMHLHVAYGTPHTHAAGYQGG
jgi:hypothetical protein